MFLIHKTVFILIIATLLGCAGHGSKESNTPAVVSDSTMSANGYDVVDTGGGGTLIDMAKKDKYGLEASGKRDYAAGIGSVSSLVLQLY